jgi:hypothetical protein
VMSLLNALWLLISAAIVCRRGQHRPIFQQVIATLVLTALLFPVISASDDTFSISRLMEKIEVAGDGQLLAASFGMPPSLVPFLAIMGRVTVEDQQIADFVFVLPAEARPPPVVHVTS